ncbi:MAG: toll/interleukin-1 receptor domain-containing protein [Planctomycetota bacterium]
MPLRPKKVFLSHSSRDRVFADRLVSLLRSHGVRVWYSRTHIRGAQQWHDEIGRALARCDWFLLVLSPHSVKSLWVKRELLYALQKKRYEERIIPLLYKKCRYEKLSWTLDASQFVPFASGFDAGCEQLLRIWGLPAKRKRRKRRQSP